MAADYELWYAMIENDRRHWPVMHLNVPVDSLSKLLEGARYYGISTAEFIEMVVREKLAEPQEWWEAFYAIPLEHGPEPCFYCGEPAEFVDISFEAPFCNSGICNWAINEDLRMLTATV